MRTHLTAREAAAELGISTATLYAYVSRGLVRSEPQPGSRSRLYQAEDIRALRGRTASLPGPATGPEAPSIETALTLIHEGRLFYRGVPVEQLAAEARLEAVATLLWDTGPDDPFAVARRFPVDPLPDVGVGVVSRLLAGLATGAERDPAAYARSADALARTGARILRQMTRIVAGADPGDLPVHRSIAEGWGRPEAADLVRTALVVTADHELAASTLAVRVAVSTGASPWRAITAGLACLDGPRHGGAAERVGMLLDGITGRSDVEARLVSRLRAGETIPGFGHPLYPAIDPRCRILLDAARSMPGAAATLDRADAVAEAAERLVGRAPNLDFGLVVACRAAGLPEDAPIALFAVGRTVGWIGHVIEEASADRLIRLRATYVGRPPG